MSTQSLRKHPLMTKFTEPHILEKYNFGLRVTARDCAFPTARMDQIALRIPTDTNMHCIYYCIHGPSP